MKQTVKTLALFTILLALLSTARAQLKNPFNNALATDIKKVIADYPNRFYDLLGEVIIQNPQSTDYQCNFKVTGAEQVTITEFTNSTKKVASWEAIMFTGEEFGDASKKYKSICTQLNNLSVVLDGKTFHLKGSYEAPSEAKTFNSTLLSLEPGDESLKKLKVEVLLESAQMDWKVKILVYDRDRDDDQRGDQTEN